MTHTFWILLLEREEGMCDKRKESLTINRKRKKKVEQNLKNLVRMFDGCILKSWWNTSKSVLKHNLSKFIFLNTKMTFYKL